MFHISKYSQYSKTFFLVIMVLDTLCLYLAFDFSFWKNFNVFGDAAGSYSSFYAIWVLLWIIISLFSNQYNTNTLKRVYKIIQSTGKIVLIHILFIFVYLLVTPQYFEINYIIDAYFFSTIITIGAKVLLLYIYRLISNKQENKVNYIIVGYTSTARKLLKSLEPNKRFGHQFYGFFDDAFLDQPEVVDKFSEIEEFCKENNINQIYFASSIDSALMTRLTKYANNNYIRFAVIHDLITLPYKEVETSVFNNVPIISGRNFSRSNKTSLVDMKRLINSFRV